MKNSFLKIEINPKAQKTDLSQFSVSEASPPKEKDSFVDIPQSFSQLKTEPKEYKPEEDEIYLLFDLWCQVKKQNQKPGR